ncbi:MAG: hydrolase [Alphaproteobacteria bacterium]|jgi:predicted amidohydrolase|nr:hydrolase [Alphaproteobacteria bacterium]
MRLGVLQDAAERAFDDRLARLDAALAAHRPLDLVLCPELFTTGYGPYARVAAHDEAAARTAEGALAALARRHRVALVYGTVDHGTGDHGTGGRRNAARLIDRHGRPLACHAKRALPPFAVETLFAPGTATTVVDWEGVRLGLLVCFDVEFPENVRAAARAGAELILVPTALWDRVPIVARKVVPVRAYENGVFVAYANYCGAHAGETYLGESVVCAPDGRDLARAADTPTLLTATLDRDEIARARQFLPFLELATTTAAAP